MRSGEYRLRETASGPPSAGASAQPLPHNPRKQRENPAAAGSGERFHKGKWRRRRDSNPRDGSPSAPLAGVCLRPLGHISADPYIERGYRKQGTFAECPCGCPGGGAILSKNWKEVLWDKFAMVAPRPRNGQSSNTAIASRRPARHRFEGGTGRSRNRAGSVASAQRPLRSCTGERRSRISERGRASRVRWSFARATARQSRRSGAPPCCLRTTASMPFSPRSRA